MKVQILMLLGAVGLLGSSVARAGGPTCSGAEQLLSWPETDPVWEMCWLPPNNSSGPQGSGLELRNVYYQGILVLKTAHAPLLFAEYTTSTCYRDWKDSTSNVLAEPAVRNQLGTSVEFNATTSCDRSDHPTQSYGACPFQLPGHTGVDCFGGVAIEDRGDHVVLTTQYNAAWYSYSSRFIFHANGSFEPLFGFGNYDGTNNGITHWHHNYWRLDFDIDGPDNDVISVNDVVQATEFTGLRDLTGGPGGTERTWEVRDTVTNRGYRLMPSAADYITPTNESGRNFHTTDVIGTVYVPNEYGDLANNPLGACTMSHNNLANGGDLDGPAGDGTDVVLYYRVAVRDQTGVDSMVCKDAGPVFVPLGVWGKPGAEADLSVEIADAPDPVQVEQDVTFTVTVSNGGPDAAGNVQVVTVLPPELIYQSATGVLKGGPVWDCAESAGTVTCDFTGGTIANGGSEVLQITATADAGAAAGDVQTQATVSSSDTSDPVPGNNSANETTTIELAPIEDEIFAHDFECASGLPGCEKGNDDIVVSGPIDHPVGETLSGTSINWITGDIVDDDPDSGYDINLYTTGGLAMWWNYSPTLNAAIAVSEDSADYLVLESGDTIGPASTFSRTNFAMPTWRAGATGYLGFRFDCSAAPSPPTDNTCYGYLHLQTTGPSGFPATILDWAYNQVGDPITIP